MEVADDFWGGIDARADLHAGRLVIVFSPSSLHRHALDHAVDRRRAGGEVMYAVIIGNTDAADGTGLM